MRKTVCILLVALAVCAGVLGQSADFEMNGTTLVRYRGMNYEKYLDGVR